MLLAVSPLASGPDGQPSAGYDLDAATAKTGWGIRAIAKARLQARRYDFDPHGEDMHPGDVLLFKFNV